MLGVTAYASGLVGSGDPGTEKASQGEKDQASSSESDQPAGGGEETTSGQAASEATTGAEQEDTAAGSSGGSSEEDAEQAITDHYAAAESGDYETAYDLLSERFRQTQAPSQAGFSSQFETLQSLEFEEGPTAQVSGSTATVTGVTIATHSDRTERNTVSWTLVDEGGEWKIDGITFRDQQLI